MFIHFILYLTLRADTVEKSSPMVESEVKLISESSETSYVAPDKKTLMATLIPSNIEIALVANFLHSSSYIPYI